MTNVRLNPIGWVRAQKRIGGKEEFQRGAEEWLFGSVNKGISGGYDLLTVTEISRRPLTEQLEELGAQLAWVREYL